MATINFYSKEQTDTLLSAKANVSSLAPVATSGDYADLNNKPALATVATTGSYNDLSNKPTIPTITDNTTYYTITY